jgi:hypothetical protein
MPNVKKDERREAQKVFYCVICSAPIDARRVVRKAVTCSEQHAAILKLERRRLRDAGKCRACNRPSTPEERAEFAAWRRSQGETRGRKKKAAPETEAAETETATPLEAEFGSISV